jgi:serine/threonine-protein kinase
MMDGRIEIDEALEEADTAGYGFAMEAAPPRSWRLWAGVALACGILLGALVVGGYHLLHRPQLEPLHFAIPIPEGMEIAPTGAGLAISPDGRRVVFRGQGQDEVVKLLLFDMNQQEAVAIEGTDKARRPFFSPCGQWVAFFADDKLQKVSLVDGTILPLCEAPGGRGGHWGKDDRILFASRMGGFDLHQVAATGGVPQPFHTIDRHVNSYYWPHCLAGTGAALAIVGKGLTYDKYSVAVVPPDSSEMRLLTAGDRTPTYVPTGHILYSLDTSLLALRFDINKLEPRGDPFAVLEGLSPDGPVHFAISDEGTLVYVLETEVAGDSADLYGVVPVWVDREGRIDSLAVTPGDYIFPNISPDGRHVAFTLFGGKGRRSWILELERGILAPLSFGENDHLPIWSPDGSTITFSSDRGGGSNLYIKPSDGSGEAERLTWSDYHQCPCSWSPDGRTLVYAEFTPETGGDLLLIDPYDGREPRPFLKTPTDERHGMISPDGHWMAYASNPAGQAEVFIRPYPGPGAATQVSTAGGIGPLWSPDGSELFFRAYERDPEAGYTITIMTAVPIDTQNGLRVGQPRELFRGRFAFWPAARCNYDISRDGERFLMITAPKPQEVSQELRVVLNWFERLKELE